MDWSVDDSGSVVRLIQIYTHPHTHKEKANLCLKYVHPVVSPPNQFGFYITVSERMHCDVYNWPTRAHTQINEHVNLTQNDDNAGHISHFEHHKPHKLYLL